jgi:hypothetical protein
VEREPFRFDVAEEVPAVGVGGFLPVAVEVQAIPVVAGKESLRLASQTVLASVVLGTAYFVATGQLVVALAIHRQFVIPAILRGANVAGQGDCLHPRK